MPKTLSEYLQKMWTKKSAKISEWRIKEDLRPYYSLAAPSILWEYCLLERRIKNTETRMSYTWSKLLKLYKNKKKADEKRNTNLNIQEQKNHNIQCLANTSIVPTFLLHSFYRPPLFVENSLQYFFSILVIFFLSPAPYKLEINIRISPKIAKLPITRGEESYFLNIRK